MPAAGEAPKPSPVVRVGVGVLVLDSEEHRGRVLAGRRKGSHGAGSIALPGGHLELAESVAQCAVREIKEETNLDLEERSARLVGVTQDVFDPAAKHYITLIVACSLRRDTGPLENLEPHKCEGWGWFTLAELKAKQSECFLPLQHALDSFLSPEKVQDLEALRSTGQPMAL